MYKIIILDTNIYRQLGTAFYEHIDYVNLIHYGYSSGAEILVTPTVVNEYLDFYKREILEKNTQEIKKALARLIKLEKFRGLKEPDYTKRIESQLKFVRSKLIEGNLRFPANMSLAEEELISFLIENKQEGKKDNTRDYLIWLNTLHAAQHYLEYQIILISEDRIFTENAYFQQLKAERQIENISVYRNIPAFLSVYGFSSPMLTSALILKSIPVALIEKELLQEKNAIPSYISYFYYSTEREFSLEEFRIENIKVDAFYAHKNVEENKVEIIAQIMVMVYMLFEPEQDTEALNRYMTSDDGKRRRFSETFDQALRPVFHQEIMFLFSLEFSEDSNSITNVEYLNFFPD